MAGKCNRFTVSFATHLPILVGITGVRNTGRSPGLWSSLSAPSRFFLQWYFAGYSHLQWRDRVGFSPTSLLSLLTDTLFRFYV
jgi:hypothetical protein